MDLLLVLARGGAHALLDLPGHGQEGLLDVARVLGRRLEEGDTEGVCEFLFSILISLLLSILTTLLFYGALLEEGLGVSYLGNSILDHLLIRHIALIAHKQLVHALSSVAINLLQPLLDVVERVHVGDVVDDADAVRAAIVRRRDGAEALLARCVPLVPSCQFL